MYTVFLFIYVLPLWTGVRTARARRGRAAAGHVHLGHEAREKREREPRARARASARVRAHCALVCAVRCVCGVAKKVAFIFFIFDNVPYMMGLSTVSPRSSRPEPE